MKFKIIFITIFFSLTSLTNCADSGEPDPKLGQQYIGFLEEVRKEQANKSMSDAFQGAKVPLNYIKCKLPCGCFVEFSNLHGNQTISVFYKSLYDFYKTKHKCKKRTVSQLIPVTQVLQAQQIADQRMNTGANLVQCLPEKNDKPGHVEIDINDKPESATSNIQG